jgi:hypothetical protein
MHNINVYRINENSADINPLSVKRDWMDETYDAHAYKCFPLSLTNSLGWGLSFPKDITFIWDGISDSTAGHVKVLEGHEYVYTERANATISFKTGLMFRTKENISILQMPAPNYLYKGAQPLTTLMSTSFYKGDLPCAWRITEPNVKITIKANTPFISVIPISLSELQNSEVVMKQMTDLPLDYFNDKIGYSEAVVDINKSGLWSNFYRNATDHLGKILGKHEVKSLKLKVKESNNAK